jgi:hypothetical protein
MKRGDLVTLADTEDLLRLLGEGDAPLRKAAMGALVQLPLEDDGWWQLSAAAKQQLDSSETLDEHDVRSFVMIPTREVRKRLHERLHDPHIGETVLLELAKVRDEVARDAALDRFATGNAAARRIAAEAATCLLLEPRQLGPFADDEDAVVGFWGALALARQGDPERLTRFLTRHDPPEGLVRDSLDTFVNDVAAHGPFPRSVVDQVEESASGTNLGRVVLEGMRGGALVVSPRPREVRGGKTIAELVPEVFAPATRGDRTTRAIAGNDAVEALRYADASVTDYDVLLGLYETFDDVQSLKWQLAWTAQRGGIKPMVRALGAAAVSGKLAALDLLSSALRYAGSEAPPKFGGSGPPVVKRAPAMLEGSLLELPLTRSIPPPPPADHLGETREASRTDDVPRSFYALAIAPAHVVVGEVFTLTAGTTERPPTQDARQFDIPAPTVGEYTICLTLHAVGFTADVETTFELHVTAEDKYPTLDIRLTPDLQVEPKLERPITLFYAVDGQVIGSVEKKICVHFEADEETRAAEREVWHQIFTAPVRDVPPDLTVMITDDGLGNLAWSFITPHDVPVTRKALHQSVGRDVKSFAELMVNQANARDGKGEDLYQFLVGLGIDIAKAAQRTLWLVLKGVAKKKAGTPSLLLISNEPYIPWELATMPAPLDRTLPPFLGVQTCMGRWIICDRLPPPRSLAPQRAAVVSGKYTKPGWPSLPNALAEAETIRTTYGATEVEATMAKILAIFEGQPAADLLHFSMHGQWNDKSVQNGLITIDGGAIAPQSVAGAIDEAVRKGVPKSAPFVFLNACQVAGGSRILGDYGGLAAAFVKGGATAVIAPLWSINDAVAKQIALDFYEATLHRGEPPAEVIRLARAKFTKQAQSGIYLAYQFFGHPSLRVDGSALRPREQTDGRATQ